MKHTKYWKTDDIFLNIVLFHLKRCNHFEKIVLLIPWEKKKTLKEYLSSFTFSSFRWHCPRAWTQKYLFKKIIYLKLKSSSLLRCNQFWKIRILTLSKKFVVTSRLPKTIFLPRENNKASILGHNVFKNVFTNKSIKR